MRPSIFSFDDHLAAATTTFLGHNDIVAIYLTNRAWAALLRDTVRRGRTPQLAANLRRAFRASDYATFHAQLEWPLRRQPLAFGGGRRTFRALALPQRLLEMLAGKVRHPTVWATSVAGYLDQRFMFELACCGVRLTVRQRAQLSTWGEFVYRSQYLPLKRAVDEVIRRTAARNPGRPCLPQVLRLREDRRFPLLSADFTPFQYGSKAGSSRAFFVR